ncbi:MAG: periplasmic heavy metal sensor [Burkholderiales bacterium]|nr:periplasmic heavy metal sensor [Burkholderiales bacterium]
MQSARATGETPGPDHGRSHRVRCLAPADPPTKGDAMNARIPSIARPMQVAAAIVFGLGVAASGGAAAGGPMRGAAGGPVGGPPGAPGGMIEHVLASMKDRLALDSSQQVMFDRIRAQTVAAHDQASAMRADVRAKVDAELAKAEPDLAAVSAFFDNAEEQGRAARRQIRDQWLTFYANLRADQKAIVRDAIRERIARMDDMHDRMRGRMQHRAS